MAYKGYDYTDWFETPEGKAYFDKYMSDIGGINEDHLTSDPIQQVKNAFYQWTNTQYEIGDNIASFAKNSFWNVLLIGGITLFLFYQFKKGKL